MTNGTPSFHALIPIHITHYKFTLMALVYLHISPTHSIPSHNMLLNSSPLSHTNRHAHTQQQLNQALSLHMPLSYSHTPHDKHTPFTHTLTQTHLPHTRGSSTHDRWLLMVMSGVPSGRCATAQRRLFQFFVWTLVNSVSTQADGGTAHMNTHPIVYP